ncbi:MAG: TRAP transporter large permease subunit [Amylibacter sp.]
MAIKMKTIVTYHAHAACPTHSRTEIGLLTPPLGVSCFVIKSTINDDRISLKDVFIGALPFAFVMLIVLFILIQFPILSLALV